MTGALQTQAVSYIKTTLDRPLLVAKLRADLARMMEVGTVYAICGAQLVTWQVREERRVERGA